MEKERKKSPESRYSHRIKYDFLTYIRLIMKWAVDNHDLSRPEIELLLYLYGQGTFTKNQFSGYYSTLGMYQTKGFNKLNQEGWIRLFRDKNGKENALYILTTKGQRLCSRMHLMSSGEEKIPTSSRSNVITKSNKSIDKYYLEAIKRMNRNREK